LDSIVISFQALNPQPHRSNGPAHESCDLKASRRVGVHSLAIVLDVTVSEGGEGRQHGR
jgi:hypothetical protein